MVRREWVNDVKPVVQNLQEIVNKIYFAVMSVTTEIIGIEVRCCIMRYTNWSFERATSSMIFVKRQTRIQNFMGRNGKTCPIK